MSRKSLIWIGVFVGSTLGAFIPSLWGESSLSVNGVIFETLGGLAGIWAGFKLSQII